jgi:hypothetical protein
VLARSHDSAKGGRQLSGRKSRGRNIAAEAPKVPEIIVLQDLQGLVNCSLESAHGIRPQNLRAICEDRCDQSAVIKVGACGEVDYA